MNRTTARSRVRQLLAWMEQEMIEGLCPQCGMVGVDGGAAPADWQAEHGAAIGIPAVNPIRGLIFRHLEGCPLEDVADELERLVNKHHMRIEPAFVQAERGYVRVLRLVEVQ